MSVAVNTVIFLCILSFGINSPASSWVYSFQSQNTYLLLRARAKEIFHLEQVWRISILELSPLQRFAPWKGMEKGQTRVHSCLGQVNHTKYGRGLSSFFPLTAPPLSCPQGAQVTPPPPGLPRASRQGRTTITTTKKKKKKHEKGHLCRGKRLWSTF